MTRYDVFNGDADGICALHQWRMAFPAESVLVTGLKRDIALLGRVHAQEGDEITVFDLSLDKNREALAGILANNASVRYFDHHYAGDLPEHPGLTAHIDPAPDICTSLLVDAYLEGRFRIWAVIGAFGDNLRERALAAAEPLSLGEEQLSQLWELGTCLNYNGYGVTPDDLFFLPDQLYRLLCPYGDPFAFMVEEPGYATLREGYREDMAKAAELSPEFESGTHALYLLPSAPWARRVSGVFGNDLAHRYPARAHALLTALGDGDYRVSVRAPLTTKTGADTLCRSFATGGGRQAAAGINRLRGRDYDEFAKRFQRSF